MAGSRSSAPGAASSADETGCKTRTRARAKPKGEPPPAAAGPDIVILIAQHPAGPAGVAAAITAAVGAQPLSPAATAGGSADGDAAPAPEPSPPPANPAAVIREDDWPRLAQQFNLTRQQIAIVRLLLDEASDYEIEQALSITNPSVREQLRRIRQRTGARSRVGIPVAVLAAQIEWLRMSSDEGGDTL